MNNKKNKNDKVKNYKEEHKTNSLFRKILNKKK